MNRVRMKSECLWQKLDDYGKRYPEERALAQAFAFFSREADFLSRHRAEAHATGSAWVVSPCGEKALLTHHRKLGRWLQLGGHGEGEADPFLVAWREAKEESGLKHLEPVSRQIFDLDRHWIPARPGEAGHWHWDFRYVFRARAEEFQLSEESLGLAWVEIRQIAEEFEDPSLARMARKWRNRRA